jgi:hypothetical protein
MLIIPAKILFAVDMLYSAYACYLVRKRGVKKLWINGLLLSLLVFIASFQWPEIAFYDRPLDAIGILTKQISQAILAITLFVWLFSHHRIPVGVCFGVASTIGAFIMLSPTWVS